MSLNQTPVAIFTAMPSSETAGLSRFFSWTQLPRQQKLEPPIHAEQQKQTTQLPALPERAPPPFWLPWVEPPATTVMGFESWGDRRPQMPSNNSTSVYLSLFSSSWQNSAKSSNCDSVWPSTFTSSNKPASLSCRPPSLTNWPIAPQPGMLHCPELNPVVAGLPHLGK